MTCSQLGYLQSVPLSEPPPRMRSRDLKSDLLQQQCAYIFPKSTAGVEATIDKFNQRFGGASPDAVNTSRVIYLRYEDDPWAPLQPSASRGEELPVFLAMAPLGERFGRRKTWAGFLLTAGAALLMLGLLTGGSAAAATSPAALAAATGGGGGGGGKHTPHYAVVPGLHHASHYHVHHHHDHRYHHHSHHNQQQQQRASSPRHHQHRPS